MNVTAHRHISCAACGHDEITHGDRAVRACAPWDEILTWDAEDSLWRSHPAHHRCDCRGWEKHEPEG